MKAENLTFGRDPEGELVERHHHAIASITDTTTSTITIVIIVHILDIDFSVHLVVIPNPSVDS